MPENFKEEFTMKRAFSCTNRHVLGKSLSVISDFMEETGLKPLFQGVEACVRGVDVGGLR